MRRAFLSLMTSAFLCLNLTSVASADSQPNNYTRQAGIIDLETSDWYNVGVRSHFTTSTYQTPAVDGANQFFWVGQSLSNGTFYQAGIRACGSQCLQWFAQAYDANSQRILSWLGSTTTPAYHDVAIQMVRVDSLYNWYPTFDGVRYQNSDIWNIAPNSGPTNPKVFAELSLMPGGPMPNPSSQLGPLTATDYGTGVKALQTKFGTGWQDALHAYALFVNKVCPPINVYGWGYQSASMGTLNGYACAVDYNPLGRW